MTLRPRAPRLALAAAAAGLLLTVGAVVLAALAQRLSQSYLVIGMFLFAAVGALVAARHPRNAIGWIMIAGSLVLAIGTDAGLYAALAYRHGYRGLPLARLAVWLSPGWIAIVLLPLVLLLFPDGRLPSGRWRITAWIYAVIMAEFLIATAVADLGAFTEARPLIDASGNLLRLDKGLYISATDPVYPVYAVVFLAWILRQALIFRSATGDRRSQLKWLVSGATVAALGVMATLQLSGSSSVVLRVLSDVGAAGMIALPLSIGIAILKYRLFDIDRIISRTLAYAIITALLAGTFVGLVVLTTDVLPFSSSVGVAASTLAAAALFNPLRLRVQRVVDRRFNRARYDAEATVDAFAARLRDAVDLDAVESDLLNTVQLALQPASANIWIRSRS